MHCILYPFLKPNDKKNLIKPHAPVAYPTAYSPYGEYGVLRVYLS